MKKFKLQKADTRERRQLAQSACLRIGAIDDKAELQEFEIGAQKQTLTIACQFISGHSPRQIETTARQTLPELTRPRFRGGPLS